MSTTKERAAFTKASKRIAIEPQVLNPNPNDHLKYESLMDAQYRAFMQAYSQNATESSGIHHGFYVVGRILQQAPMAYANFLTHNQRTQYDADELATILETSYETAVVPLANTSNRSNKTLETWYGITGDNPIGNDPVYQITAREDKITFEPHPENRAQAQLDLARRTLSGDLEEVTSTDKCPALAFVLPKLWGTMAVFCATRTEYFEADVEAQIHATLASAVSE